MKPHKHAELIKAWADGAEIEYLQESTGCWITLVNMLWYEEAKYRIKPEPKTDVVATGVAVWTGELVNGKAEYHTRFSVAEHWQLKNLKLTFDGETGDLKSAEVMK